ncbi:MAG: phosphotransferase [Rhodobacteraceae bacterium]|nr:phosphotransferase [Paracoccaceae bacterium]
MSDVIEIARLWGEVETAPELIAARENAVYSATIKGERRALRVHRAGYQSRMAIESELRWMSRLADVGFPCPRPVESSDGTLLRAIHGGSYASVVSWLEGPAIGSSTVPLPGDDAQITALYSQVGALIAAFHDATDAVVTDDVLRPAWDADTLLGEEPLWGRFWENPTLTQAEGELLLRAKSRAYDMLVATEDADAGLIHADCLQENILATPAGLALIDFDDAGFGYRLYDLGSAMVQHYAHPKREVIEAALIAGYGTLRVAPSLDELRFYTMLRAMASCGWVITRGAGDPDYQRSQADRAIHCAEGWLS